ncbi:MAG: hypothetical protein ACOCQQ_03435, partial [Candidatus Nanoarchaeia archaeon]
IQRQTAKICNIAELLTGEYIVAEGWEPNYVYTKKDRKLSRVNIMAFVVDKENPYQFKCDDGTGTILVTDFNQTSQTASLEVGQPVLLIGRPRQTNDELFIALEIVQSKQLRQQPAWLSHRKKELKEIHNKQAQPNPSKQEKVISKASQPSPATRLSSSDSLTGDDVIEFVRKKDDGEGVLIQEVINYFGDEADDVILTLMSMGEIYEITSGTIKVLE